ncbi:hypothetical protein PGT21_006702 [Puccinia graminis f. sp. tritici]|uniref:Uncharacterized protein n=1 Tax=Puccinia graminis f. sp. tritici TaxID=56615 RepID=A0A5B0P7H1_PUCGR|nr:hypothetical protein PGT21_006702 [Puccinia graminis f. sp. tritici]KAA1134204.1 hypothetical protein PGTUg99_032444 [Puccinia graminis f. sp. tritici]
MPASLHSAQCDQCLANLSRKRDFDKLGNYILVPTSGQRPQRFCHEVHERGLSCAPSGTVLVDFVRFEIEDVTRLRKKLNAIKSLTRL